MLSIEKMVEADSLRKPRIWSRPPIVSRIDSNCVRARGVISGGEISRRKL